MPRSYQHIEEYEEEILRMKSEGKTRKEIGDALGFSPEQIHSFITRRNRKQKKLATGMVICRKGRLRKRDYEVTEETKTTELRYILARKEARIKQLEMENELMRDFLSLTERK